MCSHCTHVSRSCMLMHALPCSFQFAPFAPPHTVASIKRSLCRLEGLSEPDKVLVFTSLSSPTPKETSARLSFNAPSGPGLSEHDLIALVVESEKRSKEVSQLEKLLECTDDTDIRYGKFCWRLLHKSYALVSFAVYYRIYLSEGKGDEKAKTSFDENDDSLGRINTLFVVVMSKWCHSSAWLAHGSAQALSQSKMALSHFEWLWAG